MRAPAQGSWGRAFNSWLASCCVAWCGGLAACGDSSMKMDGTLRGEMKGDLNGSMRIDGPIQMSVQMRGPTIRYEGVYISDSLLDRVDTGKTRTDWVLAVLGEPTSRTPLDDGSEIWKWAYRPVEQEVSIISVFGNSKDEPALQPTIAFIHVREGIVVEKWRD